MQNILRGYPMRLIRTLILIILMTIPIHSFSEVELIENYLPYDTVFYTDIRTKDLHSSIKSFLNQFIDSNKLNAMYQWVSQESLRNIFIDITDPQSFTDNGFDMSQRSYFALLDFKLSDDFIPYFILSTKISDKSKAEQLIQNIINKLKLKIQITSENYKNTKINLINHKIIIEPRKSKDLKYKPYKYYKQSNHSTQIQINLPEKYYNVLNISDKTPKNTSKSKNILLESISYAFIDNYLFVGQSISIKKIIDSKLFRENIKKDSDYKKTFSQVDNHALIRGYISYKNLSPLLLSELLTATYGTGFSIDFSGKELIFKGISQLNPNNSFYQSTKKLFTPNPKSNYLIKYLPYSNINYLGNLRLNLRESLKSLSWKDDFILLYAGGLSMFFTASMGGYYYGKTIDQFSISSILGKRALDLIKDFTNNIGNDFNVVQFNFKKEDELKPENMNILAFCEVDSMINGYKLINKLLKVFKDSYNKIQINEIKISDNYFYHLSFGKINLFLGLQNKHLMIATQKDTLDKFIYNITNNVQEFPKYFSQPKILKMIDKSYFNFFYSFETHEDNLKRIIKDYPQLGFLKNLKYLYINEKREGDVFKGNFTLKFKE